MVGRQPAHPPHLLLEIPPVAVTTAPAPVDAAETVELPVAPAEVRALSAVQRRLGAGPVVATARGMSHFGEHAGGWLALGLLGALDTVSIWRNIALMGLILLVMAIVDNRRLFSRYEHQTVVLDSVVTNRDELIGLLEHLLDGKVHSARPLRVDLINDSTVVDVRYARTSSRAVAPVSPAAYAARR